MTFSVKSEKSVFLTVNPFCQNNKLQLNSIC